MLTKLDLCMMPLCSRTAIVRSDIGLKLKVASHCKDIGSVHCPSHYRRQPASTFSCGSWLTLVAAEPVAAEGTKVSNHRRDRLTKRQKGEDQAANDKRPTPDGRFPALPFLNRFRTSRNCERIAGRLAYHDFPLCHSIPKRS